MRACVYAQCLLSHKVKSSESHNGAKGYKYASRRGRGVVCECSRYLKASISLPDTKRPSRIASVAMKPMQRHRVDAMHEATMAKIGVNNDLYLSGSRWFALQPVESSRAIRQSGFGSRNHSPASSDARLAPSLATRSLAKGTAPCAATMGKAVAMTTRRLSPEPAHIWK